jgi:exonuclease VII small subunit
MGLKFRRGSTAQQSGSLAFGEPYVNTTLGTLVVGGATGDIVLSAGGTGSTGNFGAISGSGLDITGNANIAGNLTLGGAITIGDASADTVNVIASLSSSLIPQTTNVFDLGSATKIWRDLYISTGSIKFVAGTTVVKELTLSTLTALETATGSSNVSITNLNTATASLIIETTNLELFSGSANTRFTEIGVVSGSLITSASAAKTTNDSQGVSITNINSTTASLNTSVTNLNSTTASLNTSVTNINLTTASLNTSVTNLNSTTASLNTSVTNINLTTASLNTSVSNLNTATSSYETKGRSIVSGSSQITYASISSIPSGIVSGSAQVTLSSTTGGTTSSNVQFNSLGIGMAASATAGRIDASGDIVAFSTSDRNFKENITPIENALEKISKISGNTYDWKADMKEFHGFEGNDVGVIAQEIEAVLPQLVTTRETGYKAVKYDKLVALLIEGIKEQQQNIDNLTIQVEELKKQKGL